MLCLLYLVTTWAVWKTPVGFNPATTVNGKLARVIAEPSPIGTGRLASWSISGGDAGAILTAGSHGLEDTRSTQAMSYPDNLAASNEPSPGANGVT